MSCDFREKIFKDVKYVLDTYNLTKEELLFIYEEIVTFRKRIQSFPDRPTPKRSSIKENDSHTVME